MSESLGANSSERPLPLIGLVAALLAGVMIAVYFELPWMHAEWPQAFHPLFWTVVGGLLAIGLFQLAWPFLPARWTRRMPGFGRFRFLIPREGLGYLMIMGVLFVGSSLTRSNMLLLVFAAMAGPFIVNGSVTFSMLNSLQIKRVPPLRAMVGELFSVELQVFNKSPFLSAWMMMVDDDLSRGAQLQSYSVLFVRVPAQQSLTGYYQAQLPRRGRYEFGPIQITTRFPLGLTERSLIIRARDDLLVYPRVGRLAPGWKRQLLGATEQIETPQTRSGVFDDEFHRLREYRAGDNPRAIHWRSSARRGQLIVREYHQNREHHLLLIIDLWAGSSGLPQKEAAAQVESTLSLAATVAVEYRHECRGGSLTVVCGGREPWQFETAGPSAGLESLFDRLAEVEAATDEHFSLLATAALEHAPNSTRVVVLSTRSQTAAPWGHGVRGPAPVQWIQVTDERFAQAVVFSESLSGRRAS